MPYQVTFWVDDDGSGTTGTIFNAARMNNIEAGLVAASGVAGSASVRLGTIAYVNDQVDPSVINASGLVFVGSGGIGINVVASGGSASVQIGMSAVAGGSFYPLASGNADYLTLIGASGIVGSGAQSSSFHHADYVWGGSATIANPQGAPFTSMFGSQNPREIILLTGQALPAENGPWMYSALGTALVRPPDWRSGDLKTGIHTWIVRQSNVNVGPVIVTYDVGIGSQYVVDGLAFGNWRTLVLGADSGQTTTLQRDDILQTGVLDERDLVLTVANSGAIKTSAASSGPGFWFQGVKHTVNAATVPLPLPFPTGSQARLDQIVTASGQVMALLGTASGLPTINNRTGAQAIPGNARLLHDLIVSSAGIVAGAAQVRDRRPWAKGFYGFVTSTQTPATQIASAAIDAVTPLAIRVEVQGTGSFFRARLYGGWVSNNGNNHPMFGLWLDGSQAHGISGLDNIENQVSQATVGTGSVVKGLLAEWLIDRVNMGVGTHVLQPFFWAAEGNANQTTMVSPLTFEVEEIFRRNGINGTS